MKDVWISVWITLIIQTLVSLVVFTPPVLAPAAQPEIGVSASAVGIATALIYLSATFGALISSRAIARYGPMRVSQLSLVLAASGIALMATANIALVALGAMVIGLGYGQVTPSSTAILADRVPQKLRAFIFSVKQTGVPLGGALAGAALPALILNFGWQAAALVTAAMCAVVALVLQPWRAQVDQGARIDQHGGLHLLEPLRLVMSHARLREMALASFTYSGMQMCLGSFLVVFLHDRIGFNLSLAGAALSAAMIAGIAGRLLWGIAADRWQRPRFTLGILGAGMSAGAFATAMISPAWPIAAVMLISMVYGATAVGWNGVYLAEVAHVAPPGRAAAATGASLAMTYSGVVVLPSLFWGIVAIGGSYRAAFIAIGCLTLWRCVSFFSDTEARLQT